MPLFFIQKLHSYVRRSLAEHMRLRLRLQRIFVLETHCYLRLENHMIHLKK